MPDLSLPPNFQGVPVKLLAFLRMRSLRCALLLCSVLTGFFSVVMVFFVVRQEANETIRARMIRPDPFLLNQIKLTHEHILTDSNILGSSLGISKYLKGYQPALVDNLKCLT